MGYMTILIIKQIEIYQRFLLNLLPIQWQVIFGLDNSICTFNYIVKYANGEPNILIELGKKIKKCATDFIKKLEEFKVERIQEVA